MKFRIVFLLLLLLAVGIAPAMACSPTATPQSNLIYAMDELTIEDYAQSTPIIFVGQVIRELEPTSDIWGNRIYEIRVERYLRGEGFDIVHITGYGYGTDCSPLMNVEVGGIGIFFVHPPIYTGIPQYDRINDYPLTAENEALVTAITGQSSLPQALPLDIQLSRVAEKGDLNWLYIPLSILAVLLGLVVVGLSLRFRKRRKSKAKREL